MFVSHLTGFRVVSMSRITGIIRQGSFVDQKYCNDGIKLYRMVVVPYIGTTYDIIL